MQGQLKIQGFLQRQLIAEISYSQLQNFQAQGYQQHANQSQLQQQQGQFRENILKKVKVTYNRPQIKGVDYNLSLLNYQLDKLPDGDLSQEIKIVQNQIKKKQEFDEKISASRMLQELNNQSKIQADNQQIKNNQPHYFYNNDKNQSNQYNFNNNNNNNISNSNNNPNPNLYQFSFKKQEDNLGSNNNSPNNIKSNNNGGTLNNLYSSFKGQIQEIKPSSYFNSQIMDDALKFKEFSGFEYERSLEYIKKYGNYNIAIAKYEEEIQQQYQE